VAAARLLPVPWCHPQMVVVVAVAAAALERARERLIWRIPRRLYRRP
jgi:hypothetical protein